MGHLSLRTKLLLLSVVLALIPIAVAGRTLIRITEGELKTFTNQEVVLTAEQLAGEIDSLVGESWLSALGIVRNALEDPRTGESEKMGVLRGSMNLLDLLALQITLEGDPRPLLINRGDFADTLSKAGYDPLAVLRSTPEELAQLRKPDGVALSAPVYLDKTDDWIVTVVLPLKALLQGRPATLSAKLDLRRLRERIERHRFTHTGTIRLVDAQGRQIFDARRANLAQREPVRTAIATLRSRLSAAGATPFTNENGERMVGGFAPATTAGWAVVVERSEATAYLAVRQMTRSLWLWVSIGFVVAVLGAVVLAHRITGPIIEIGRVAQKVGEGDFAVRVARAGGGDEISQLAARINEMVAGLAERERVKSENAILVELTDRLRSLNEQKNRLLGMAAHDLRNPIGGILGYSEMLLEDEMPEEHRTLVSNIERSSKFMLRLLNDLLDISQIESGKLELNLAPCDLSTLVRQNVELNRIIAARKHIRIELDCALELPAMTIDAAKFEQVLSNLVSNAVKYSYPETLVRVSVARHGDGVRLAVTDQGQGIPAAELPKVFQAFQKTSVRSTAGEKSTGLGLAIVKRIVEAHGGAIGVESEVGQGSTFWFTLLCSPPRGRAERVPDRDPRIATHLPLRFTVATAAGARARVDPPAERSGDTLDLSVGGLLVESATPLRLGDQIHFRLSLEGAELRGSGIVTRLAGGSRYALRFSDLESDGDDILNAFLARRTTVPAEESAPR